MEGRVASVEHPLKLPTPPTRNDVEPHVESRRRPPRVPQADLLKSTSLEARNDGSGDPSLPCHVRLSPSLADAHRPQRGTYSRISHEVRR
jgi:hypothetical protein